MSNELGPSEDVCGDFDTLPVVVRKAMRSTIRNWGSKDAHACLAQGMDSHDLARMIREMDRNHALQEGGYKQNPSHIG